MFIIAFQWIYFIIFIFFAAANYSEHDDRSDPAQNITIRKKNGSRRVSFKTSNAHRGDKQNVRLRSAELGLRAHFGDDDANMIDFDGGKASSFRRRNSPVPGSARNKAKGLIDNASGWFQVTVSNFYLRISSLSFDFFFVLQISSRFHMDTNTKKMFFWEQ